MARAMKDSGIEWIGDIPLDWNVSLLKYSIRWKSVKGDPNAPVLSLYRDYGVIPKDSRDDNHNVTSLDTGAYKVVDVGDFVINKMKAWQGSMAISKYKGIVSPAYHVCEIINDGINKEYFHYLMRSPAYIPEYLRLSTGMRIGQWDLGFDDFRNLPFLIPSLEEQRCIADFLDRRCAEIDSVIAKTEKTIEEYKALKQSIITEAVTKGIRPNRPMKDSGIAWIGEIPNDWTVSLLKYSIRWKSVKGEPDAKVLSLYRDYGVVPKDSRDDNHNVTSLDTGAYKVVDIGDLVINKMKAWQGSLAISDYHGIVSPAYHICEIINPDIFNPYIHHLLRNQLYKPEYLRLSTGMRIGQWDLGFDDFKNLPFILPSYNEQIEIVNFIEEKSKEIDLLVESKQKLLSEFEAYKLSVIYEYVTGKKEVVA